eukprot:3879010-Rhodomonas_salina.2
MSRHLPVVPLRSPPPSLRPAALVPDFFFQYRTWRSKCSGRQLVARRTIARRMVREIVPPSAESGTCPDTTSTWTQYASSVPQRLHAVQHRLHRPLVPASSISQDRAAHSELVGRYRTSRSKLVNQFQASHSKLVGQYRAARSKLVGRQAPGGRNATHRPPLRHPSPPTSSIR